MSELFYNKKGFRVWYSDGINTLPLTYVVYDHLAAQKYWSLLKASIDQEASLEYETSFMYSQEDLKSTYDEMNNIIRNIKTSEDIDLGEISNLTDLNALHHKVEEHEKCTSNWAKLNRLIHKLEQYISMQENKPHFNSFFSFNPNFTLPLEKLDLLFFRIDRQFGDLCVGYNTLGKNWLEIATSDDVEHIPNVEPQKHLSAESYMILLPYRRDPMAVTDIFARWYREHCNQNDLNLEMALGYCVVGKLIMPVEWEDPSNTERDKWLVEILKPHDQIKSVELIETGTDIEKYKKEARMKC